MDTEEPVKILTNLLESFRTNRGQINATLSGMLKSLR